MPTTVRHLRLHMFLVAGVLLAANAWAQERAPVPESSALEAAQKAARELYGKRFAQAKTVAEKTAVAKEMLEAGETLPKGSADQYAVWKIARDVATGAGDVATALDAADKLAERFDVPAAKTKAETLLAARRQVNRSTQHKALTEAALKVLPALIAAEDYEAAASLVEAARASAQSAREYSLVKAISARAEEIKSQQKASQGYRDSLAVLKDKPTDPAANLTAGSYRCFVKSDWEQGVAMLARGSDAQLQAVAAKDLKGAESAESQFALGDEWWALAETRQGREKESLMLRAGFWYGRAEPRLAAGLTRVKVQRRLADIAKLDQPLPSSKQGPAPRDDKQGKDRPPLAVAPFDEKQAKGHQLRWSKHLKVPVEITNSIGMKLVLIPPGEFKMGSAPGDGGTQQPGGAKGQVEVYSNETPAHRVRITKHFYMGTCEVTQEEYQRVMGQNPSFFAASGGFKANVEGLDTRRFPLENANWTNAVEFCRRLTELPAEKATGRRYRLPTEAEWEYACRAGSVTRWFFGDDIRQLGEYCWHADNSGGRTQPVGQKRPNAWGLHDTYGHVWEWCSDRWGEGYYAVSPVDDPPGPDSGEARSARGGARDNGPGRIHSASRNAIPQGFAGWSVGFRVVATSEP